MGEDGTVQAHLALSRRFLATAQAALQMGEVAPAQFNAAHALELAVKAALAARTGTVPRTHNVGGEFGRHFRETLGTDATRRVKQVLRAYDSSRYPDAPPASPEEVERDLAVVEWVVEDAVPRLLAAGPPR